LSRAQLMNALVIAQRADIDVVQIHRKLSEKINQKKLINTLPGTIIHINKHPIFI